MSPAAVGPFGTAAVVSVGCEVVSDDVLTIAVTEGLGITGNIGMRLQFPPGQHSAMQRLT